MNELKQIEDLSDDNIHEVGSELLAFPAGDLDNKLANVDKAFELIGKLRTFALKHLSSNSVVNENGKPYIQENGVNVFDAPFGIFEKNVKGMVVKENGVQFSMEDPDAFKGKIIAMIYSGIVGSKTLGIEFSFEGGVYYSEKDVNFHDRDDFIFFAKKAKANWRGRARRKLLGLDNISWTELAKYGINKDDCANVERKSSRQAKTEGEVQDENKLRSEIEAMLREFIVDATGRSDKLEELTSFKGKDGMVPGVRNPKDLTGRRLEVTHAKTKEWHAGIKASWGGPTNDK